MKVNLGCPKYCEGWICVDLAPKDARVVKMDAIDYLIYQSGNVDEIKAKNLIEHLPNVGTFFQASYIALKPGGRLDIITDNAEFIPFYIPIIHRLGFGAHSSDLYHPAIMNGTRHYSVFTKLHILHYASRYNFKDIKVWRLKLYAGARIRATMVK